VQTIMAKININILCARKFSALKNRLSVSGFHGLRWILIIRFCLTEVDFIAEGVFQLIDTGFR